MKRISFFFVLSLLLSGSMIFTSCNPEVPLSQLEQEDAVELIQASVQTQTGGLEDFLEVIVDKLDSLDFEFTCDSMYGNDFDLNYQGPTVRASYEAEWTFFLACTMFGIPDSADLAFSSQGDYGTARIDSEDSTSLSGILSGLKFSLPELNLNGTYIREGSQTITSRNETQAISSQLDIQLQNIKIDKYRGLGILSGLGAFTFTGDASGNPFSYTGTIDFLGNKTATLVINGSSYFLDWS